MDIRDELREIVRTAFAKADPWTTAVASGWHALTLPEAYDGASLREAAVVLEEVGRACAGGPFLGTLLAVHVLTAADPSSDREAALREIASGTPYAVAGLGRYAVDATAAAKIITVDGRLFDAASVRITGVPLLDETRDLATVETEGATPLATLTVPSDLAERADNLGTLAVAIDALGVAGAMLDATVAYAKVRTQFNRPIGSFQAVKHACANLLVRLTLAQELITAAVDAAAEESSEAARAISMAKAYATESAVTICGDAMQLHGGIGYTWESGVHRYLKRAMADRELFGSPALHRQGLAGRYRAVSM